MRPPFSFIERLFVFNIHYLHLKCNIFPKHLFAFTFASTYYTNFRGHYLTQ
nr:MAG TPA: hypothetical protein [Caudoviricetes sp.]